jgi:tRNA A37 threonylcarbamoyladenosine synthetase subunit TsaC/SUA5/YrdC
LGGGVVIAPSDIGYGIVGASTEALDRIFRAKQRGAHKRNGVIGGRNLSLELQVLGARAREMVDTITLDFGLPVGVIAPYRADHPFVSQLQASKLLLPSSASGTIATLVNAGPFADALADFSLEAGVPLLGSSANLTGTGSKYRLDDIQPEVRAIVDLEIDYGLLTYHESTRSSTMINFDTMRVVRIGIGYEVIRAAMARFFKVDLPADPGREVLPSGHLWQPEPFAEVI